MLAVLLGCWCFGFGFVVIGVLLVLSCTVWFGLEVMWVRLFIWLIVLLVFFVVI